MALAPKGRSLDRLSFSVIINTDNRLEYLKRTLAGLRYSTYSNFEICVVSGPTDDGTREYLETLQAKIKTAHCSERILSRSRNIGIAMSAGDIICFIDDDAVPEPEWLSDLAVAYEDEDVGAAGGFVYDNSGVTFQSRYVTTNRLGYSAEWDRSTPHFNFPLSSSYPHLLGTNCSFRRSALLAIQGFDEEYEYFLDETDVCCRLIDNGYRIAQLSNAFVHHKYAPSHLRDERRIVRNWYPLVKNRIYFSLRNGRYHHTRQEALDAGVADASNWETTVSAFHAAGEYTDAEVERFYEEMRRAFADAQLRAGEPRKMLTAETQAKYSSPFLQFETRRANDQRFTICLVTQDYPPDQNGGIARNVAQLATSLAAEGHHVHVLTRASGNDTVDFEDGVWVSRVQIREYSLPQQSPIAPHKIPQHIWNYSHTMLDEVRAIGKKRTIDLVYCPLWDCEPVSFVIDGTLPLVVALQTTMKFWLESQPQKAADEQWMANLGEPIVAAEEFILMNSLKFHANSRAIVKDINSRYETFISEDKIFYSPHGMQDWVCDLPQQSSIEGELGILFVGRLESRKGVDTLLQAALRILEKHPTAVLHIAGDDTILRPDGKTYKGEFLQRHGKNPVSRRIRFHGKVDEEFLRELYSRCDIFVAPSRYESFGLVFVEAMMFGKPVIAGNAGGAPEVVIHNKTGLLVRPGDPEDLGNALEVLLQDRALREKMGRAGRQRYEEHFTDRAMVNDFSNLLTQFQHVANVRSPVIPARARLEDWTVNRAVRSNENY